MGHLGTVGSKDYECLKEKIVDMVQDSECRLYFHSDSKNVYKFDKSNLPCGGIYGLRERRADDEDMSKNLTARKLQPIQSATKFQNYLRDVSKINYMQEGRRSRQQKI